MSTLTPKEAIQRAIEVLGGPVAAARLLQVKGGRYQTVQSWVVNRVPAEYCPAIEHETGARGAQIVCELLRPDVAWEVLRRRADEPTRPNKPQPEEAGHAP